MNIESVDVLISYTLLIIYAKIDLTPYYISCLSCLLLLRTNHEYKRDWKRSMGIYFNHPEQGMMLYPLVLNVLLLLHSGKD